MVYIYQNCLTISFFKFNFFSGHNRRKQFRSILLIHINSKYGPGDKEPWFQKIFKMLKKNTLFYNLVTSILNYILLILFLFSHIVQDVRVYHTLLCPAPLRQHMYKERMIVLWRASFWIREYIFCNNCTLIELNIERIVYWENMYIEINVPTLRTKIPSFPV